MESKNELKETDIKNHTCYYFDDIIKAIHNNCNDILLEEKLYKENCKNIYDISYKTSTGGKPLCIRYDEIDGFIKIQDRIRYLVLFDCGWFDKICDKIKYLINKKVVLQIVLIIILYVLKKY